MRLSTAGRALLMFLVAIGLNACAGLGVSPEPQYDTDTTRDLVAALYGANEDLVSAKWIGKASMAFDGSRRTFDRAVWAGTEPGRVRFDARTPFGLPVLSLACDETHLTALAHSQGQYYRKQVGDNSLGRLFPVDISCRDLYRLMTGRPPAVEYHAAQVEKTAEGVDTVRLSRRFKGTVARLWVDTQNGRLTGFERLNIHGKRSYRAWLTDNRLVEGYNLPYQLHLESTKGRLDLETARFFPNSVTAPSLFQIRPPR